MNSTQAAIISALGVNHQLNSAQALGAEIERRKAFIKDCIKAAGSSSLVLGISGGVDSTTTGLLCQAAARELSASGYACRFIAMRLPYDTQHDEDDAQASIALIAPDQLETVNIKPSVDGLMAQCSVEGKTPAQVDFVKGNVKARSRMLAQYAVANLNNGLVVGTDHAAEALMGFFTKFGDGACDLAPLSGLTKTQVRAIAQLLGAPEVMAHKVPTADLEELHPGKPDEMAYGCTYAELDAFLMGETVAPATEAIILAQYAKTAHKRVLPYSPV